MQCFLSLAKTRKLSSTAAAMDISLSTLYKHIDKMESDLSAKLFLKDRRKLTLTREGELILSSVEYIVKQFNEQHTEMSRFASLDKTSIKIALAFHQRDIVRSLIAFMKADPNVRLRIFETAANEICQALDFGEADIGVVYEELIDKKYPVVLPIRKDRLVAVVAQNHPLAGRDAISMYELRSEKFFLFKGDHMMHQYLLRLCISAGFVPEEEHSDMRMSTILKCIASDFGISLLPENIVDSMGISGVVAIGLAGNQSLTMSVIANTVYPTNAVGRLLTHLSLIPVGHRQRHYNILEI